MNAETRAAFAAMRDHLDQLDKMNQHFHTRLTELITQNDKDIKALRRRIQTLSQTKIVQLMELSNFRFELMIQKTDELDKRLTQITTRIEEHII